MATLGTFTSGQVLTAAELNAIGTWTTYTPVVTQGSTITNGANTIGQYIELNELVIVQVYFKPGSAGIATQIKLSTPTNISTATPALSQYGSAFFQDAATNYPLVVLDNAETASVSFASHTGTNWFGISPFIAISTSDTLSATFCYKKG